MNAPAACSVDTLSRLQPVGQLKPQHLQLLAQKSRSEQIAKGQLIHAVDEHRYLIYLMQGELALVIGKRVSDTIEPSSATAKEPLFSDNSRERRVLAKSDCTVLRIEKELFEMLSNKERATATEVTEVQLSQNENEIFSAIYEAYQNKMLNVPALPDVALKVRNAMQDSNIGVNEVAQIVQSDPVISARLLNVANSAMYKTKVQADSVRDAINRLGLKTTRDLAMVLAVKQLFQAKSDVIKQLVTDLYHHATKVSSLCFVLAKQLPNMDPDKALLAGLVHDIGAVPILGYADEYDPQSDMLEQLSDGIAKLQGVVGSLVLQDWGFGSEFLEIAEQAEAWSRNHSGNADYCDIVIAAQLHVLRPDDKTNSLPHFTEVPAVAKVAIGEIDPQLGLLQLLDAQTEIDSVHHVLEA